MAAGMMSCSKTWSQHSTKTGGTKKGIHGQGLGKWLKKPFQKERQSSANEDDGFPFI